MLPELLVGKAGRAAEISEEVLSKSAKELSEKLEQKTAQKEVKESFNKAETELEDKIPKENKIDEVVIKRNKEIELFVAKYASKLETKPNEAFFWSGRTDGVGGQDIALEIALSKEGITLEGLIYKNKIPMPIWEERPEVWEAISEKYAQQVSGEIRAVIGERRRSGNVWESFELPALKKNLKVTTIDPKTGIENVIFKR